MAQKVFTLPEVRNHAPRNGFDLSERSILSGCAGMLLPVYHRHLVPGDHFSIDYATFTRTETLARASFGRFKEYFDWFFVPFSSIWRYSDDMLANVDNDDHAIDADAVNGYRITNSPCVQLSKLVGILRGKKDEQDYSFTSRGYGYTKLLDLLGYGNNLISPASDQLELVNKDLVTAGYVNVWNAAAYQAIYQRFYRNDNWEFANPRSFNFDYLSSSGGNINANEVPEKVCFDLFQMRYADYPKDMFTGLYPSTQYGSVAVVSSLIDRGQKLHLVDTGVVPGANYTLTSANGSLSISSSTGPLSVALGTEVSILDLRKAEALQRWKEIQLVNKKNYKSQIEALYGVKVNNRRHDIVDYLGGSTNIINIQDVTSTSENSLVNLGDLAGKGLGASNGQHIDYECHEHGVLMCIYHVIPIVEYGSEMLDKENTLIHQDDYYNPLLGNLGLEGVRRQQFAFAPVSSYMFGDTPVQTEESLSVNPIIGYGARYLNYKSAYDKCYGVFARGRSLSSWSIPQSVWRRIYPTDSEPNPMQIPLRVNFTSFKCYPSDTDNTFISSFGQELTSENQDQFRIVFNCDVKAIRPMDVDGMPY